MSYKQGTYDADKFQKEFGLSTVDESEAYSEGSTTGTKQVGALGTYLTKDDYNRLKNDSKVWDAYASVHGSDAMEAKREQGDMSINTLDALMDKLSTKAPDKQTDTGSAKEEPKMEMSPEYAHAKARVQQWTDDVTSGRTGKELFGQAPDSTSFLDRYKLHLGERLENGNYRPKQYAAGDSSILDKNSSVLTADEAAINELNRFEKDPREDY